MNQGPSCFTEVLYAWASTTTNNGSTLGGLEANAPGLNLGLAAAMLIGRLALMLPALLIAGRLGGRKRAAPTESTLPTYGALFGMLLATVLLVTAGLTYLPAVALGPIAEALRLARGVR